VQSAAAAGDSITVAAWTIVSRVTGVAKFACIGAVLGPTFFGNTYQFTSSLPNLVYYGFLSGSPNMEEIVSPVKGMEYMAFGMAFVAFDLTETRVLAGEAAVYARPGDVPCFARLIDDLLNDPAQRAALGHAGRQLVTEWVAWDRQEYAYLGVYERLLGEPRAGLAVGGESPPGLT
jgi:hypothetical protein